MIVVTEAELAELRRRASEPDARLKDMIDANKEAERYAGRMETALERIVTVVKLVNRAEEPSVEDVLAALYVIEGLAMVKDDRATLGRHYYAPKQG